MMYIHVYASLVCYIVCVVIRESLRDYGPGMVPGAFAMMDRRPPPWMMGGDGPPGMPHGSRYSIYKACDNNGDRLLEFY